MIGQLPPFSLFDAALEQASTAGEAYDALAVLIRGTVGAAAVTVTMIDATGQIAARVYGTDDLLLSANGRTPVMDDVWFRTLERGDVFVANTPAAIAEIRSGSEEILARHGVGAVMSMPLRRDGALFASINCVHEEGYYTPDRVAFCRERLTVPAIRAVMKAQNLG